jgi:hypothetical protein
MSEIAIYRQQPFWNCANSTALIDLPYFIGISFDVVISQPSRTSTSTESLMTAGLAPTPDISANWRQTSASHRRIDTFRF